MFFLVTRVAVVGLDAPPFFVARVAFVGLDAPSFLTTRVAGVDIAGPGVIGSIIKGSSRNNTLATVSARGLAGFACFFKYTRRSPFSKYRLTVEAY